MDALRNISPSDKSERIRPKTKEEIERILIGNDDSKSVGHFGFSKKPIKELRNVIIGKNEKGCSNIRVKLPNLKGTFGSYQHITGGI